MSVTPPLDGAGSKIYMQVGEQRFITTIHTLTGQFAYFQALLSSKRENMPAELRFFIDLDGEVFAHVLRYLRSGVFPVFYDKSKGHDYSLYAMLLGQARFLQIPRLERWLTEKTYLQAITITSSVTETELELKGSIVEKTAMDADVKFRSHIRTRSGYVCPRRIGVHMGEPNKCGKLCDKARANSVDKNKDEDFVVVAITRTKIEFDQELCMKGVKSHS